MEGLQVERQGMPPVWALWRWWTLVEVELFGGGYDGRSLSSRKDVHNCCARHSERSTRGTTYSDFQN